MQPRVLERRTHEPRRVPVECTQGGLYADNPEPEPAVHEPARAGVADALHRLGRVLRGLRDPLLGDDADTEAAAGGAEAARVVLARHRLLDEDTDLGDAALGDELRPEDRLVGERAHRQRERPRAEPVLRAGDGQRGDLEPLLDLGLHRLGVVGDRRPEDGDAALVDEVGVGVDDPLDRALRQPLDLAEDHLDRTVDDALLEGVVEDQAERVEQVVAGFLRIEVGQHEVEQVAELDRLRLAHVRRHGAPLPITART